MTEFTLRIITGQCNSATPDPSADTYKKKSKIPPSSKGGRMPDRINKVNSFVLVITHGTVTLIIVSV